MNSRTRQQEHIQKLIEQAFRQSELRYEDLTDDTYRLRFRGVNIKDLLVCVRTTPQWIQLFCLFSHYPVTQRARVNEWLLQRNHSLPMVKFAVTSTDEIMIQVDIPDEAINLRTFQVALQALVSAADRSYPEFLEVTKG